MAICRVDSSEMKLLARQLRSAGRTLSRQAESAVAARVVQGVKDRMILGQDPQGRPHQRLSDAWVEKKRKLNRAADIWLFIGESRRKVRSRVVQHKIVIYIDTPYSGRVNATRPVMGISAGEWKDIRKIAVDDLTAQALGSR